MTATATRWARRNLFYSLPDAIMSVVILLVAGWIVSTFGWWVVATARWGVVSDSLHVLMVGVYPDRELWRVLVASFLLAVLLGATLGLAFPWRVGGAPAAILLVVAAVVLLSLGIFGEVIPAGLAAVVLFAWVAATGRSGLGAWMVPAWLVAVVAAFALVSRPGLDLCGGLMLSIMLTVVASVATLPLGILLAFGRRSRIPSVRICCTGYIEVMRSVPLILIVYCIWITVPLLVPGYPVPGLVRGMFGYALFYCAYVAEYVRSGLQAVPRGQVEAARSLGMSGWTVNTEIVLPQAIRVVLPALVGNVLDIFNGATLVFILGLTDFLRAGQMILADPRYSGQIYEVYAFMFVVYFATGSLITFAARKLEAHLARGTR